MPRLRSTVGNSVCISLILAAIPLPAYASPKGGNVAAGSATITQPGTNTTIVRQTTDKVVIDWRSFDLGPQDIARFEQPSSKAIALNRIAGGAPTTIEGTLTANGQIWLINPNGILFGKSARVDVAGLVATTLDLSNEDFMARRYRFSGGGPGAVTNAGHLTIRDAGLAALVAPSVQNSGVIEAHYGKVALGSTTGFAIDFYGDGLTSFAAPKPLDAKLEKLGSDQGHVLLTASGAKAVVDAAVGGGAVAQADHYTVANGTITLLGPTLGDVAVSGTVDVSGTHGGTIEVTGKAVSLGDTAVFDASGSVDGGTVRVGGDWHGKGNLPNASATTVAQGARISVAGASGAGGEAVVWADDTTRFEGAIDATGGIAGGSVEVSGKGRLDYLGTADLRSSGGPAGTLLLDPRNVTIAASGSTPTLPASGDTSFSPTDDDSVLAVSALQNALALGNVTVTTGSAGIQAGDITVVSSFDLGTANTLTLSAFRNVNIASGVTLSSNGAQALTLRADNTGTGIGTVSFADSTSKVDFSHSGGNVVI